MNKKFFYMKDKIKSKKERKSRKEEKINLNEILKDESYRLGTFRRNGRGFGFVNVGEEDEIFISPKLTKNALNGDEVLIRIFDDSEVQDGKHKREGKILQITKHAQDTIVGIYKKSRNFGFVVPDDQAVSGDIYIPKKKSANAKNNQKVVVKIDKYSDGANKAEGTIVEIIGGIDEAGVDMMSLIKEYKLPNEFPENVLAEARAIPQVIDEKNIEKRVDLRKEEIFTIDGEDAKDLDDAVNVKKNDDGTYTLGVHIADVSYYVKSGSKLDKEAITRGTSIYMMDRVIPMLPKELSNGICSLNPQEDRLAFSCLCELDKQGNITEYKFAKTVIRSRVKGVYSEINSLLAGSDDAELKEKYAEVSGQLPIIKELADILYKNKKNRGCPELETSESKLIINDEDICVGVERRTRGRSEEIIEDFMLVANECAARFGMDNNLPFVYRIHEEPSDEKLESLREALVKLNVQYKLGEKACPGDMSEILKAAKGTDIDLIMNNIVLRSMSKARYSTEPVGHFGLALEDYAHFTSPIRRYPDLTIHRIMSAFLSGSSAEECATKFNKFVYASADQSTKTELTAMQVERSCEDCYKAEYMNAHIGEEFQGTVVSAVEFGLFIALPDTCEGLLHTDNMPDGEYVCDDMVSLKNLTNGMEYRVGDPIRVKVINANVNSGKIDFALADEE